jgi:hypothetical protein
MGLVMNRFILKPNPKPEFKMVQPLPAFLGVLMAKRELAGAPEAVALGLRPKGQLKFPVAAKTEPFTAAGRYVPS